MASSSGPAVVKKEYELEYGPKLIILKGSIPDWPKMQHERPDKIEPVAVVNAANQRLCGGGGVDGMIHNKAGPKLAEECLSKPEVRPGIRCPTGEAVVTRGYDFKTDYIIHTCGPVYAKDRADECKRDLTNAYTNSLRVAESIGVRCVAFAAISTGVYAYPFSDATEVSLSVLKSSRPPLEEVWVVLFTQGDFDVATGIAEKLGLVPWEEGAHSLTAVSAPSFSTGASPVVTVSGAAPAAPVPASPPPPAAIPQPSITSVKDLQAAVQSAAQSAASQPPTARASRTLESHPTISHLGPPPAPSRIWPMAANAWRAPERGSAAAVAARDGATSSSRLEAADAGGSPLRAAVNQGPKGSPALAEEPVTEEVILGSSLHGPSTVTATATATTAAGAGSLAGTGPEEEAEGGSAELTAVVAMERVGREKSTHDPELARLRPPPRG